MKARTRCTRTFAGLITLLSVFWSGCTDAPPPGHQPEGGIDAESGAAAGISAAVESITPEEIYSIIGLLAHDSMGGRDTPSPGLESSASWAATEFARMGLEPGGDEGSYIQRYAFTPRREDAESMVSVPNVVGLLRGSDPDLAEEWVVFTAHFDHVSGAADETGDSIYNGADDNASGTAAVLEVAEAFSALPTPPRRSVAFVLVSGEEKGLLGARHFAQGASLPKEAMVADINADMVSRNWPDSIFVFGGEYSTLGATLDGILASHPEMGISVMENRWPQMPLFQMSDHFAFVREGIPAIFFFSGLHENLHRPSDELELVDADKAARVARLLFHLGYEVAQAADPPEWTPEGQEMLAQVGEGH
jgi:hypothetical protein